MIDTVKNKTISRAAGGQKKITIVLASLFLAACQTIAEQDESTSAANVAPSEPVKTEAAQQAVPYTTQQSAQQSAQQMPQQSRAKETHNPTYGQVNSAKVTGLDYTQSQQPMSPATRKRLIAHSQELTSNGSMPKIQYQQPVPPGLQLGTNAEQTKQKAMPVQLDYEQVEIRQILEEFADSLEMTIIIDPSITGSITMRTAPNSTLTQEDLWPLLQMLLSEAGVVLENRNGVYHAKQAQQFLPSTIGTSAILDTTEASLVMQVTPLRHISIVSAMAVLKPIAGPKGRIVQVPNLNTLLIVDKPEQLKRINGLLSLVDADPFKHRGIHLYKIKQAEAKKVAKDLTDILKLIEGNKPAYEVMGLERINALLVVAPPGRGFRDVSRWVDILDAGADEELVEQIFIYKCKSMKASSLAGTLNAIFQQEDKTVRKEKQEEQDNNPNEFRTVSKEALSFQNAVKREANKKKGITTPKNVDNKSKRDTSDEVASANINVTIVADEDTNNLLVRTTAKDYKHLLETIRTLDTVPLQVLINVVIAQVTLTDSQSFGIDWAYLGSSGTVLKTNFGQAQSVDSDGNPLGLIINRLTGDWRVTLNALAQESDVNILSRPSLLITNNDEGVINVGKEVPVETSNTTNTSNTIGDNVNVTQQIAYRKTGIELTVTPQINEDGIVDMTIKQGLSSIEGQITGADAGLNPTFTNQEINTSVVVRDGETIILGGLIESVEVEGESGVPLLKDVPLMGNLFKSQGSEVQRRELILIISTQVVDAEGDYSAFNNSFKSRYYAAAEYLDEQIDDSRLRQRKK